MQPQHFEIEIVFMWTPVYMPVDVDTRVYMPVDVDTSVYMPVDYGHQCVHAS